MPGNVNVCCSLDGSEEGRLAQSFEHARPVHSREIIDQHFSWTRFRAWISCFYGHAAVVRDRVSDAYVPDEIRLGCSVQVNSAAALKVIRKARWFLYAL